MRLVTYDAGRGPRAGVERDGAIVDVWDALGGDGPPSVRALLASGRLEEAADVDGEAVPRDSVRLLAPVPNPDKIICIGLNYLSHAREGGNEPPETPTFFAKFRNALMGSGAEVKLPEFSQKVDYEAEVAVVVGGRCRALAESEALDAVAGYTLFNDLSARDYQYLTPQWGPGKAFDQSGPCGPALVTPDEAGAADAIAFSLELNGETMQSSTTGDLIHSVPALLAYLSMLMTLEPGDLICTGTPSGVGRVREPPVFLKPGDEVLISSPTLGRLESRFA